MIAAIRQAQFEAAWYYSIVVAAMVILLFVGLGWALAGAVRMWRGGDRPAGAIVGAAAVSTTLFLIGMLIAGGVAIVATGGTGA